MTSKPVEGFSNLGFKPDIDPASYFHFSFNLFLSNCWLLAFGFLQGSDPGSELISQLIIVFFPQQSRVRVFKPGFQNPRFQFPVSNTNWYFILRVTPKILNSRFTLKIPLSMNEEKSYEIKSLLWFILEQFVGKDFVLNLKIFQPCSIPEHLK